MFQIPSSQPVIKADKPIAGLVVAAPPPTRPKPSSVTIAPSAAAQIKDLVEHLYGLGLRPIYEALCAIEGGAGVVETLRDYSRLDPAIVKHLGADQMPRRYQRRKRHSRCRRWWP
jgi:hypothetical protein